MPNRVKLLRHRKQYRVTSPKIALNFFIRFTKAKGPGFTLRFLELPERCAIELGCNNGFNLSMFTRALKDAKIIKYEIPFEVNKVIKLMEGRREGRDFK